MSSSARLVRQGKNSKKSIHSKSARTARVIPVQNNKSIERPEKIRRRSSFLNDLREYVLPNEVILNSKPKLTETAQIKKNRKEQIEEIMDNIIQTTSIYAGEDMQNIDKRHEFIENMRDELSKDEIVDMFKSALDKLDAKQTKNNTDSRTANSILFVGLISISDLVSDLICCYIYITSGDIFLQQLGYTSLGFLAFSVSFGTLASWFFAAPCKY